MVDLAPDLATEMAKKANEFISDARDFTKQAHALGRDLHTMIAAASVAHGAEVFAFDELDLWLRDAWAQIGGWHLKQLLAAKEEAYAAGIEKGKAMGLAAGAGTWRAEPAERPPTDAVLPKNELKLLIDRAKKVRVTQGRYGASYEIEV